MNKYYCRAVGENDWAIVEAITIDDAASKYVQSSPTLIDFCSVGGVEIFVKDLFIYKFKVTEDYKAYPLERYKI